MIGVREACPIGRILIPQQKIIPGNRFSFLQKILYKILFMRRLVITACVILAGLPSHAHETDPYTHRDRTLLDSLEVLDREVNATLDDIASSWHRGEDEWPFVMAVYWRIGGIGFKDKLQIWAMKSPEVDRIEIPRDETLIADFPRRVARIGWAYGVGPNINLNGVFVGADKIGHFLSQGRKIYGRYRRFGDEARALRRSILSERLFFGRVTTGVLSNADLVANYEGYRFYRSLFHDDIVVGKDAIFTWLEGRPVRQRPFTWADHVNPFWDEALNPNIYAKSLIPHVEKRLLTLCDDFTKQPQRYVVPDRQRLEERYQIAGIRPNPTLNPDRFLGTNCPDLPTTDED